MTMIVPWPERGTRSELQTAHANQHDVTCNSIHLDIRSAQACGWGRESRV